MIKIAVIDDQEKYLLHWKLCLQKDAEIHAFLHHSDCLKHYENNKEQLNNLLYIISDRFVPHYDALRNDFANEFKRRFPSFKGKILLSSSAHKAFEEVGRGFFLSIGKEAKPLEELRRMVENKVSKP